MRALLCVLTLCAGLCAETKTVGSLSEFEAAIEHSEGKELFDDQMKGIPRKSGFGELPSGLDKAEFLRWIAHKEDPALLHFAGARSWGKEGQFVAAACFARDEEKFKYNLNDTDCAGTQQWDQDNPESKFYLGVFIFSGGKFKPIAKTQGPITKFPKIVSAEVYVMPSYQKFDLADYRLNEKEKAFGVRGSYSMGYAGGGGDWELLQLFRIVGDKLVMILSVEMYELQNIAGSWHDDGTRDHDISEYKATLHVLKSKTGGFYNLMIKSEGKVIDTLYWDSEVGRYPFRHLDAESGEFLY